MADWQNPKITSNYITFVDEVKTRDIDAITLQLNAVVSPPTGAIKLVRAPVKFQEWTGSVFADRVLSLEGGGTGAAAAGGARTNLGLGSMAVQNSNAIAVTGGSIANMTSGGTFTHSGGQVTLTAPTGHHALVTFGPPDQTGYAAYIIGATVSAITIGLVVQSGYQGADYAFQVRNRDATITGLLITGDQVMWAPYRLVIPVGANLWAPS